MIEGGTPGTEGGLERAGGRQTGLRRTNTIGRSTIIFQMACYSHRFGKWSSLYLEHSLAEIRFPLFLKMLPSRTVLLDQFQDALLSLVGLRDHRGGGLIEDLCLGERCRFGGEIHILDA